MSLEEVNAALPDVSISILKEHYRTHVNKAHSAKVHLIYVTAIPVPDDLPAAMKVVEQTLAASVKAEALYHHGQAHRFKLAIEAIEADQKGRP